MIAYLVYRVTVIRDKSTVRQVANATRNRSVDEARDGRLGA